MKIEQFVDICKRLNSFGVEYVVIGGFAVLIHGFERTTQDVDLMIDTKAENIKRIQNALKDLLPEACSEITPHDVDENIVVRMVGADVIIDLMKKVGDIDYSAIKSDVIYEEIDGVKIPVAGIDSMIELKKGVREQDKKDYLFLQGKKRFLKGEN